MKMAKRDTEILVDNNSSKTDIEEVTNTPAEEIEIKPNTPSNNLAQKKETLFTIRLRSNHSCYIGGTYYVFEKNKVYQVPADVKRILTVSGLLAPL